MLEMFNMESMFEGCKNFNQDIIFWMFESNKYEKYV